MTDTPTTKPCSTCREVKPLDEFNRCTANKQTGRQGNCKACARRLAREWVRRHNTNRIARARGAPTDDR